VTAVKFCTLIVTGQLDSCQTFFSKNCPKITEFLKQNGGTVRPFDCAT